ncbi:MAG TPA: HD domain-containing protein [Pedobacter sp.]|uniref:HD domain-containing protein n=1 Tax=Pedobacter sp. TaxID=1411316 RepID=UPI002BB2D21E|nr:HD domain-containing protein [Pedobacter sp.]HMI02066.1 HD domain-containing protein [Pedobacter sp.]
MQFKEACEFILDKLRDELPSHLTYHSIYHTLDVCGAAKRIGRLENITATEMKLLLTAACYHDCGYLTTTTGHEEQSCNFAEEFLPGFGYSNDAIAEICVMIRATRIPQAPQTPLAQILADADLDYLGREDFFTISEQLFLEFIALGLITGKEEWNRVQIKFFENHRYFTATAINLRQVYKEKNLQQIKAAIKKDIE